MKNQVSPPIAELIIAAFTLDAPIPIRVLYGLYGGRTSFHNWKKMGLDVKNVPGMGPTVMPLEFKAFITGLRGAEALTPKKQR